MEAEELILSLYQKSDGLRHSNRTLPVDASAEYDRYLFSQAAQKLSDLLEENKQYKKACESAAETLNFLRE